MFLSLSKINKSKADQIAYIIEILSNFFGTKDCTPPQTVVDSILRSVLLPLIENAFRAGSLLDIVKFDKLYISYLRIVRVFSKVKSLSATLIEIDPRLKPQQTEPIYKLLEQTKRINKIYATCLQTTPTMESEWESEHLL